MGEPAVILEGVDSEAAREALHSTVHGARGLQAPVRRPRPHADTVEVLHTLRPLGVAMAGAETFDPYKG